MDKRNFVHSIKANVNCKNTEYEKKKFMDELTENPELLENFSNNRLEKILKYYIDENNKKRKLLKQQ